MAKRKGGPVPCPVPGCGRKDFANQGAAASHVRLAKDALHVAHRSAPPAAAPPVVSAEAAPPVSQEPAAPVVEVRQEKSAALAAEAEKATAQEKPAEPASAVVVAWTAPAVVAPLAGTADQEKAVPSPTGEQKPAPGGPPATVSDVPLEPFLAAGVASAINAFALDPAKGDRLMTNNEVAATGFPKALEVSVRKYWPNLPLDHPLVLLGVSGTALVAEVKAHRAPRPKKGETVAADLDDADELPATPEPAPQPVPAKAPGMSAEAAMYAAMLGGQA